MDLQPTLVNFIPKSINWHKYNLAKTQEKRLFYQLLSELCSLIPEPIHENGRPPVPIKDLVFSACLKLYSNYSGRKISSDLFHAQQAGYLSKTPHFNTLNDFLNCPQTFELLQRLLIITALPLKCLEDSFSIDSSGFGSYSTERWKRFRYEDNKPKTRQNWRDFLKGHICIGTRTNVICSCEITYGNEADCPQAPKLLESLGKNFNVKEVSADKAYCSKRVMQIIQSLSALPYIPFKENAAAYHKECPIWGMMYNYFKTNNIMFMKHYHKRSNVETTFSMIKLKLGEFLKCKKFESQRNELMIKFICHNITCLIAEIFENEVHINFKQAFADYERVNA